MVILDQSQFSISDFQAYFHEGDFKHDAGYSDYENEFIFHQGDHYKRKLNAFFGRESINGDIDVLELGGARGHRAIYALDNLGLKSWEIIDLYDSPLKQLHRKLTYTFGDAKTLLADSRAYADNQKDVLVSFRFLDCIPEADLPALITQMNRVSRKQLHIITKNANPNFYNTHDLTWWQTQGFPRGTVLLYSRDFTDEKFDNIVRVT